MTIHDETDACKTTAECSLPSELLHREPNPIDTSCLPSFRIAAHRLLNLCRSTCMSEPQQAPG